MNNRFAEEAYSFDDVLLVPSYSDILPKDVETHTRLTRELSLNIPHCQCGHGYCNRGPDRHLHGA